MVGVLLTPGPVTTHMSVKRLSQIFNVSLTKTKFMTAANQLEAIGLGKLIVLEQISNNAHIFVKTPPWQASEVLMMQQNKDLATPSDYAIRYDLPSSAVITDRIKRALIDIGVVPEECFKTRDYVDGNTTT